MSDLELFGPDFTGDQFEECSQENGFTYWLASDLMIQLSYESSASFNKAVNKAMTTCNTLNIPIMENFIQIEVIDGAKRSTDFKLSRFACYLTVMNADNKKPAVARAQAYFASLAGAVHGYLDEVERVERLVIRGEVSEREQSLSGVAHQAGAVNYAFFQNAGYRGMYNKNIRQLKALRGVPENRSPLDYMGREELAANLFRITQTELKIKQDRIKGQMPLEAAAENVGRKVRQTMREISGVLPENLPKHEDIKSVKQQLKKKSKEIKQIDQKRKK